MSPTIMAFIMIGVIIGFVFYKKVPMQFVLAIVPIICAIIMGVSMENLSIYIVDSANTIMKSAGYMLLFGLMYFTLLSETGMFDIIVDKVLKLLNGKVNVWIIMILTTIVSAIGGLTASVASAYLITFPIMMPLYKKINFDKKKAMIIAQTSIAAMCFVPWGIGMATTAAFAEVETMVLVNKVIPIALCFLPAIVLQWIYFALDYKKQENKVAVLSDNSTEEAAIALDKNDYEKKVNPNERPKLFYINFIVFIASLVALAYFKIPAYIVFIFSAFLTTMINYPNPKDYQPIWKKSSTPFYNTLLMFIGISVFVGIFKETGMLEGLSNTIVSIFPEFLTRYMHIILLAICVLVLRFVPYQIYNSLYPVLIGIGATFGIEGIMIVAPFVCNLALATGSSPMNPTTHVGASILDIDIEEYAKEAIPVQTITNLIIIAIGIVFRVII